MDGNNYADKMVKRPEVSKHDSEHVVTKKQKMTPLVDTVKTIENSQAGHDDDELEQ